MEIGSVLFGLALAIMAAVLVTDPFLRRQARKSRAPGPRARELRHSALLAIRDLDFDHQTGKVVEEDYQAWRASLLEEAARWFTEDVRAETELGRAIEGGVATIRKARSGARSCPSCGQPQVHGDQFCAGCGAPFAEACGRCGAAIRPGDRFCSACGEMLVEAGGEAA